MTAELHDELKNEVRKTQEEYDEYLYGDGWDNAPLCKGCDGLGHSIEFCPLNKYY